MVGFVAGSAGSGALQAGQRLAKPGLSGFNSNSSEQILHTLIGNVIATPPELKHFMITDEIGEYPISP